MLDQSPKLISTPTGAQFEGVSRDMSNVVAVSIIRAGDSMLDTFLSVAPEAAVGKILIQRNEETAGMSPFLFIAYYLIIFLIIFHSSFLLLFFSYLLSIISFRAHAVLQQAPRPQGQEGLPPGPHARHRRLGYLRRPVPLRKGRYS